MVPKKSLRQEQIVTGATLVADVAKKANALVAREYRGPGDTIEGAMSRAERRWGVPFQTFWSLRYRPPKDVLASIYLTIQSAYEAAVASQEARLREALQDTRKALGDAASTSAAVAAAASYLDALDAAEDEGD